MPLCVTAISPQAGIIVFVFASSLVCLAGLAAHASGASLVKGALRVTFWGTLAMAVSGGAGALFGAIRKRPVSYAAFAS